MYNSVLSKLKKDEMMQKINCKRCSYYYVTWDKNQPHGCKAFGFKSKAIPSIEVLKNSAKPCTYYKQK